MQYDYNALMFINGFAGHYAWLDHLVAYFSKYGPLIYGVYLISLWFSGSSLKEKTLNRKIALHAFFAAILAMGINMIIGLMWFRNRPYVDHSVKQLVTTASDASFPSDHAAGSFSIAGIVLFERTWIGVVLAVASILLSLSRVYVGVHYPSDILGGMTVGLISSLIVDRYSDILEKPVSIILSVWNIIERRLSPKAILVNK